MSDRLERLRRQATRPRRTIGILLDGQAREQIEAVEDALDRLDAEPPPGGRLNSKRPDTQRAKLVAELDRLRTAAVDATLILVLEGLPRTAFRALLAQHPPRLGTDGKVLMQDRLLGANAETLPMPLVRACAIGYRESDDPAAPVLPFPPDLLPDGTPDTERITLGFLFGHNVPARGDQPPMVVEPWCTERQIDDASGVAINLCAGSDDAAVPPPRRRSATSDSDAG